MSFFSFLKRKKVIGNSFQTPFNLSPAELARLRDLQASPDFSTYLEVLDKVAIINGDALLGAGDDASAHFYRGFLSALKLAMNLPSDILTKVESLERSSPEQPDTRTRVISTYGTPYFRANVGARQESRRNS